MLGYSVAHPRGPADILGASLNLRRVVLKRVDPQAGREARAGNPQHVQHVPTNQSGVAVARSRSDVAGGAEMRDAAPTMTAPLGSVRATAV